MNEMTFQVEMGPDTHNQLGKPSLTHRTRDEAVRTISRALSSNGRRFHIDVDGETTTFMNESDQPLAVVRPVRA